jgi:hypothetical protein
MWMCNTHVRLVCLLTGVAHHFELSVSVEVKELEPKRPAKRQPVPNRGQLRPVASLQVRLACEVGRGLQPEHVRLKTYTQ